MYDPVAGRWFSEDPERFDAGDANLYRYCENNATNQADPSGLVPEARPHRRQDSQVLVQGAFNSLSIGQQGWLNSTYIVVYPFQPPGAQVHEPPSPSSEVAGTIKNDPGPESKQPFEVKSDPPPGFKPGKKKLSDLAMSFNSYEQDPWVDDEVMTRLSPNMIGDGHEPLTPPRRKR